jgi:hypothetical protein
VASQIGSARQRAPVERLDDPQAVHLARTEHGFVDTFAFTTAEFAANLDLSPVLFDLGLTYLATLSSWRLDFCQRST